MGRTPIGCRSKTPSAAWVAALGFSVERAIQPERLEDQLEADWAVRQVGGLQRPTACSQTPVAHFQPQFHDPIVTWVQTGIALGAYPQPDRNCGPAMGRTPSTSRPRNPGLGPDLTWVTPAGARATGSSGGSHARGVILVCRNRRGWTVPGPDPTSDRGAALKASTGQTARAA